jgi:hypothetical protein
MLEPRRKVAHAPIGVTSIQHLRSASGPPQGNPTTRRCMIRHVPQLADEQTSRCRTGCCRRGRASPLARAPPSRQSPAHRRAAQRRQKMTWRHRLGHCPTPLRSGRGSRLAGHASQVTSRGSRLAHHLCGSLDVWPSQISRTQEAPSERHRRVGRARGSGSQHFHTTCCHPVGALRKYAITVPRACLGWAWPSTHQRTARSKDRGLIMYMRGLPVTASYMTQPIDHTSTHGESRRHK